MRKQFLFRILIPIVLAALSMVTKTEELPVETFFKNYEYVDPQLSPNGQYLAVLAPTARRVCLAVIDLTTQSVKVAGNIKDADVSWFTWFNDNRLLLRVADENAALGGLFAVNRDGSKFKTLVPATDFRTRLLDLLGGVGEEILVESIANSSGENDTWLRFPHVSRLNVYSGGWTREVTNPGHVLEWIVDHRGVVRIGVRYKDNSVEVIHRSQTNAAWETLFEFKDRLPDIEPIAFSRDNQSLYVEYQGGEDTAGLYSYDLQKKVMGEVLFRHKEVDWRGLVFDPRSRELVGVECETDRPVFYWADPNYARQKATVDQALAGTINVGVSSSRDGSKTIYRTVSDRSPGAFYLWDSTSNKLTRLFEVAKRIRPEEMAEMKPIQYRSRDGLTIHGYLTLPRASVGKNLPLVVNPHGGPSARDSWGFNPEVQFLANRGYAVLQMNFRGSIGYGRSFLKAGDKEWGLKMQDDITDGVKWAIEQGIGDPKRIAIFGTSYGGYAALMGLIRTPELYRCGISYAGVTDINRTVKYTFAPLGIQRLWAAEAIGDLKSDKEELKELSPVNHADKIQVPVFLAYGKLDPKVPLSSGKKMASELKSRGKSVELMVKDDEGHGFYREENKIEFYKKLEEFLRANMN